VGPPVVVVRLPVIQLRARHRPHKYPRESVAASPCRARVSWWAPARRSPAGAPGLAAAT